MSFGALSKIYDKAIILLNLHIGDELKKLNYDNYHTLKLQIYKDLLKEFPETTIVMVDEICKRVFNRNYEYNNKLSFENGQNSFREHRETFPDVKVPTKYKQLFNHFEKLKNLPQPAQRSQQWYDYRYNRITASDTAAAIDLNPYEPVEGFILKKCDPNFPFRDNATVFHGKKYEPTATMIYEHIKNVEMFEFGALPSEKYSFLGASPDGIGSKYSLDNKFSPMLGTMLEIKCPVSREITTKGKIMGEICPFYYFCQVQQQLVCCELDVCDFWQCKLSEYKNRHDYLIDPCDDEMNTEGTDGTKIKIDTRLKKGIILEFYPKNFVPEFDGDQAEWKSKYIIPKRLDMNSEQYDEWTLKMLDEYKQLYPDIAKDYYFYRIIYWKLEQSHNVPIHRDDKFFGSILPILKDTWDKIVYYRKNLNELDKLKSIAEQRKKYIKLNTSYTIHNETIVKNKIKFLDAGVDLSQLTNKYKEKPVYKKGKEKNQPVLPIKIENPKFLKVNSVSLNKDDQIQPLVDFIDD